MLDSSYDPHDPELTFWENEEWGTEVTQEERAYRACIADMILVTWDQVRRCTHPISPTGPMQLTANHVGNQLAVIFGKLMKKPFRDAIWLMTTLMDEAPTQEVRLVRLENELAAYLRRPSQLPK